MGFARKDFTSAISLNPQEAVYYFNRGMAYKCELRKENARKDFIQCLQLDPTNALAKEQLQSYSGCSRGNSCEVHVVNLLCSGMAYVYFLN